MLWMLLVACWEVEKDPGTACWGAAEPDGSAETVTLEADSVLPIDVVATRPYDDEVDTVTCGYEVVDGEVVVTAEIRYDAHRQRHDTDVSYRAACAGPAVPAGTYTVVYGDASGTITVPGEIAGCVGAEAQIP